MFCTRCGVALEAQARFCTRCGAARAPWVVEHAIAPDALRTNAYRVLRLPVSASASDIHKAAASMRRAATLGLTNTPRATFLD